MSGGHIITALSFVIPIAVVGFLSLWFRATMDRNRLSSLFLETFTLFAAIMVLAGAFVPRYFDELGDNRTFLIVVSLSAVLHAISSVASVITDARSRAHPDPNSRPFEKRN